MKLTKEREYEGFDIPDKVWEAESPRVHHLRGFLKTSEIPLKDLRTLISDLATGILEAAGHPVVKGGTVVQSDPSDPGYFWFLR